MHGLFPLLSYNFEPQKYWGKYGSSRDSQYLNGKNIKRKCRNKNMHKPWALLGCLGDLLGFCHSCPTNPGETATKLKHLAHCKIFISWNVSHWTRQTNVKNILVGSVELWFAQWGMARFAFYTSRLGTAHVSLAALKTQLYNHKQTHTDAQLLCRHDCIVEFYVLYNPCTITASPTLARTRLLPNSPLWKVIPIKPNLITAYFHCSSV